MTQQEIMQHPFFGKFQQRIGPVINAMIQRGMLTVSESDYLTRALKSNFNPIMQFIENINMRYPQEMNDGHMDTEIFNWLQPLIQQVRTSMNRMTGGFGTGFNPGFAGGGMWGGGCGGMGRPVGFGFDSFVGGRNPGFGGGTRGGTDIFAQPGNNGASVASLFGTTGGQQPAKRQEQVKEALKPAIDKPVAPAAWKAPEADTEKNYEFTGVDMQVTKFNLSTNDAALRFIIHDPKVGYTSDSNVLERYKDLFGMFPATRRKFMTIAYQQLRVLPVNHDEFMKMAQALSVAVNKCSDVESKLRAIIANSSRCGDVASYMMFNKLFLDELEMHIQCGELCDSHHPKNILNRPDRIEDLLAWVTGDIDKNMLAAMRGMEGFCDRLNELIGIIIETVVAGLPKIILDPVNDMTVLAEFSRALPGIWTDDCGSTFKNTEDLINIFIATRETVERSKSADAVKNESTLKQTLTMLNKQFTMIFLPRVVSWCNYSKADVCRYDERGNCQPACYSKLQPRNDVEFFVEDTLEKWDTSRDTRFKWAPKNIYMEIDEETFCLQYGRTTNGQPYICSNKYWH